MQEATVQEATVRILLVEDNALDRRKLAHSLSQSEVFAFQLCECETLAEALEQLGTFQFDVILLDLWLPDSEGLETCERLLARASSIPTVVLTADDSPGVGICSVKLGAQDYLVKGSFSGIEIAKVIRYAIERHRFRQQLTDQEQYFQQVINHVPALVWTTDSQLRISGVFGAELQRMLPGLPIGESITNYFGTARQVETVRNAHHRALAGESASFDLEWQNRTFEIRIDPLIKDRITAPGTIGVALDVSYQKDLTHEIEFARVIQETLLPNKHPQIPGFDIFGGSVPARQTCGDWFDYLTFSDRSLGLVVGDVSGKGLGPAILSATISSYLEVLAASHCNLQKILDLCNQLVCKHNLDGGQFAILSLARLTAGELNVSYVGAGESMLVVDRHGQLKLTVPSSGLPIGLLHSASYAHQQKCPLAEGDMLLMLTDGFRESISVDGAIFGTSRIVATVSESRHKSAREIFDALLDATNNFTGTHRETDDRTGIIVKVLEN